MQKVVKASVLALIILTHLTSNAFAKNVLDDPTNFDPIATFSVRTSAGSSRKYEGTIGTKFYFDARASKDPEKKPLMYNWDLDGDGKYDSENWSTSPTTTRVYWDMGVKTVKLIVVDEAGNFSHAVKDIKIVRNTPPSSFFTVEPEKGSPAQEFRFNANDARDDQYKQTLLLYRWDFDGDKVYDTNWSPRETISHTYGYGHKGKYKVSLEVKDPEGGKDTYTKEIEVLENTVPVAVLDIDPKIGTFETTFKLDGGKSFDDESKPNKLEFRWDSEYTGQNDIMFDNQFHRGGSRTSIRFDSDDITPGKKKVRMEVKDEDGKIATITGYIVLHWASPYIKKLNEDGIIYTRYDRYFTPDATPTRSQIVTMIMRKLKVNTNTMKNESVFKDVTASTQSGKYITEAKRKGIVTGYSNGNFKPDEKVTRAEAITMILRAFEIDNVEGGLQYFSDVPSESWYFKNVDTAVAYELVNGYGDGRFGPNDPITYGEIAKLIYQVEALKSQ